MKVMLYGVSGIALASWSLMEASLLIAAQIPVGPETAVSTTFLFQIGVLLAAGFFLVKFGMLLRDWKRALDAAVVMADAITRVEERCARAEVRLDAHDSEMATIRGLTNEHARRLGLQKDYFDEAAG